MPTIREIMEKVLEDGQIDGCSLGALSELLYSDGPSRLGDAPRTLVAEFAKIKSGDVVLPARGLDGTERTIRLRCVMTPDAAQKVLLNRLGLKIPHRLRRLEDLTPL